MVGGEGRHQPILSQLPFDSSRLSTLVSALLISSLLLLWGFKAQLRVSKANSATGDLLTE